jgi:hypothetical protein
MQSVCDHPPQGGWTKDEMKRRLRIEDVLDYVTENDEKVIELEDSDFNNFKALLDKKVWPIKHKGIVEFDDYIKSLTRKKIAKDKKKSK